jgi:hypothetical protein
MLLLRMACRSPLISGLSAACQPLALFSSITRASAEADTGATLAPTNHACCLISAIVSLLAGDSARSDSNNTKQS